jgi:hypothetical protein
LAAERPALIGARSLNKFLRLNHLQDFSVLEFGTKERI